MTAACCAPRSQPPSASGWPPVRSLRTASRACAPADAPTPEAITALHRHREPGPESPVVVSATNPVNLTGILTTGERISATLGNRVLYRQGIPGATRINGEVRTFVTLRADEERQYRQLLTQERKGRNNIRHRRAARREW